eukprot:5571526-Lingulodinium_polyedra.AAC.1
MERAAVSKQCFLDLGKTVYPLHVTIDELEPACPVCGETFTEFVELEEHVLLHCPRPVGHTLVFDGGIASGR